MLQIATVEMHGCWNRTISPIFALLACAYYSFAPQALLASSHLLFTAEYDGDRGTIYEMDSEGTLRFKIEHRINPNTRHIRASPDGRMVVLSGGYLSPRMRIFFIGEDGSIPPPLIMDNPESFPYLKNPVAFNSTLPLFYVGYDPISCYRYSTAQKTVEPTSDTLRMDILGPPYNIDYSPWANALVFLRYYASGDYVIPNLQTISLGADGTLGQLNQPFRFNINIFVLKTSPDGRWTFVYGQDNPQLMLFRIEKDGSATKTQEITIPFNELGNSYIPCFTPDNQGLLVLSRDNIHAVSFYEIGEKEQKLILRSTLPKDLIPNFAWAGSPALTQDGRFLIFVTVLNSYQNVLRVVRVNQKDWSLEYLPDKDVVVDHYIGATGFATMPENAAGPAWSAYE